MPSCYLFLCGILITSYFQEWSSKVLKTIPFGVIAKRFEVTTLNLRMVASSIGSEPTNDEDEN
jgi:hypothetical protein